MRILSLKLVCATLFLLCVTSCNKKSENVVVEQCQIDTVCTVYDKGDSCSVMCNYSLDYLKTKGDYDWVNKFISLFYYGVCHDNFNLNIHTSSDVDSLYNITFNQTELQPMRTMLTSQSQVFIDRYYKEMQEIGMINYELSGQVKLENTFEDILLFSAMSYVYLAGAHGTTLLNYYNIDLKNNKILDYKDIFSEGAEKILHPLIVEGLCQYFEVGKDQLGEQLFEADLDKLPLPQTVPALTKEGVLFQYQSYEITCYAAGSPGFVVPYDKLKDVLIISDRLKSDDEQKSKH